MHTPQERAAFVIAQTQMMIAERDIMIAENKERENQGLSHAHGSAEFERFHQKWESVLGYNALIELFLHH